LRWDFLAAKYRWAPESIIDGSLVLVVCEVRIAEAHFCTPGGARIPTRATVVGGVVLDCFVDQLARRLPRLRLRIAAANRG
jgi:hypothetical protein